MTLPTSGALDSQHVTEVIMPYTSPSPTTPTGAGVSQLVAEVVFLYTSPDVHVSQVVVEIVLSADGLLGGGGEAEPVTHAFGYAV